MLNTQVNVLPLLWNTTRNISKALVEVSVCKEITENCSSGTGMFPAEIYNVNKEF
jgi:hypothetical protein